MNKFIGEYEIDPEGYVISHRGKTLKKMTINYSGNYGRVTMYGKTMAVHRLVAENYVPNPLQLPEVNHKDGNKLNNHVDNLEWMSHYNNMRHGYDTGLINNKGENHGANKLNKNDVINIRKKYSTGNFTQRGLANEYGVSRRNVGMIITNETWRHIV